MDDTQKVKITNWRFGGVWTIGFMFTLGYILPEGISSFWETVGQVLFTYLLWPLLLGVELSGGA